MKLTIIVYKDYGIATVKYNKGGDLYQATINTLRETADYVTDYEIDTDVDMDNNRAIVGNVIIN